MKIKCRLHLFVSSFRIIDNPACLLNLRLNNTSKIAHQLYTSFSLLIALLGDNIAKEERRKKKKYKKGENAVNSGHYILPAMPKGRTCTLLRSIWSSNYVLNNIKPYFNTIMTVSVRYYVIWSKSWHWKTHHRVSIQLCCHLVRADSLYIFHIDIWWLGKNLHLVRETVRPSVHLSLSASIWPCKHLSMCLLIFLSCPTKLRDHYNHTTLSLSSY